MIIMTAVHPWELRITLIDIHGLRWRHMILWFSLEEGFLDDVLGQIMPGDLLSDQGAEIYENLELLSAFQPLELSPDFGLDALFIVSDADVPAATTASTAMLRLEPTTAATSLSFDWSAGGRVFQIEKATNVLGPYLPMGPVTPDLQFTDSGALTNQSQAFYRIRQW